MPGEVIRGRPPDAAEAFWVEVASKITPDKSLERLDAHGKFLFSTVSVVGTLLAGFGFFSPTAAAAVRNPWLLVPVFFACISLALAMTGLTPSLDRVNRSDIESVRAHYNRLIRRRGRAIIGAGWTFALSLFLVGLVMIGSLPVTEVNPRISARLAGTGDKTTLSGKIEVSDLAPGTVVEADITGVDGAAETAGPAVLFKETARVDQRGAVTLSAEIDGVAQYRRFVIRAVIRGAGDRVLHEHTVEIGR